MHDFFAYFLHLASLKDDGVAHAAEALDDIVGHEPLDVLEEMALGVGPSDVARLELRGGHRVLLGDALSVRLGQRQHGLDRLFGALGLLLVVRDAQAGRPRPLVQIHQHRQLELILAIVDRKRVIVPVEAMDERLRREHHRWKWRNKTSN